jgi:integrase
MGERSVVRGEVVTRRARNLPAVVPQHVRDEYLPQSARELILRGIPPKTLETYARAWRPFRRWCEAERLTFAPVHEHTMIRYVDTWRDRPVHVRCKCREHRPAPSSMWVWYAAVRFYHGVGSPPLPWECGENLTRAMLGYADEMVNDYDWRPHRAPRAEDSDVTAMVDALDLSTFKGLRDRAIILTNFYTAARASDLATYRMRDMAVNARGVELTLSASKTNRNPGKKFEVRRVYNNRHRPQYDGVQALTTYAAAARSLGLGGGALFLPTTKHQGPMVSRALDPRYKMDTTTMTEVIQEAAKRAGLDNWADYTCHSLRRGRATQQRELGVDPIEIARAYGWVPGGSILVYLEEAEAGAPNAPGMVGML